MTYSVRDEENFEPVYNEDEEVVIRKGDLRAILDVATQSMDFYVAPDLDKVPAHMRPDILRMLGV